jgi:hypothetical protein
LINASKAENGCVATVSKLGVTVPPLLLQYSDEAIDSWRRHLI